MLSNQRERPLLQSKRGAFLYANFRPLAVPAECGEHRHVGIDPQRIIAPMPSGDHAPVKVEDPLKLPAVESGDWAPVPSLRERRDDAQALFTFGRGWLCG